MDGAEKAAQEMEKDVLRELHRAERGKLQAQQAEAADNQARDAVRQQRADALAEVAEAADAVLRRQPDQGIEAPGGGAEAQLQGAGAGAEDQEAGAGPGACLAGVEKAVEPLPESPPGLPPPQEAAKKEEARQQEDAQRQEEEAAKEEKARRQEAPPEEARRQGEEAAQEEEARRQEAAKEEEESRPQEEEAAMEEEARRQEEVASRAGQQEREKELEEDKERAKFLRRKGLLSRVLVDHDDTRFCAHPGGVDAAKAHVASVLNLRRVAFSAAMARAHATTPARGEEEFLPIPGGNVLARHLQAQVEKQVNLAWRTTEEGQYYVQKAMETTKEAAEKNAGKGGKGARGPPVLRRPARRKLRRGQPTSRTTGLRGR